MIEELLDNEGPTAFNVETAAFLGRCSTAMIKVQLVLLYLIGPLSLIRNRYFLTRTVIIIIGVESLYLCTVVIVYKLSYCHDIVRINDNIYEHCSYFVS